MADCASLRPVRTAGVLLALLALVQAGLSIALLGWTGAFVDDAATRAAIIERYAGELRRLEEKEPDAFRRAPGPDRLLRELHVGHLGAERMALMAGLVMMLSSLATAYGSWVLVRRARPCHPGGT